MLPTVHCSVCEWEIFKSESTCQKCNSCFECTRVWLIACLKENKPVTCPQCPDIWTADKIIRVVGQITYDGIVSGKYKRPKCTICNSEISILSEFRYICSNCTYTTNANCCSRKRHQEFCVVCNKKVGFVHFCKNPMYVQISFGHIKPCPNCFILIEKTDGCNKMEHQECGHVFCWKCLKKYDYKCKCTPS